MNRVADETGERSPATCPYRGRPFFEESSGKEYAPCMLLGDLTGLADSTLFRASRGACEVCCKKRAPSKEQINSVVASLLHALACKVRDAGGMPGCDRERAEALEIWARNNLTQIPAAGSGKDPVQKREKPCFYLGAHIGEKPCETCKGSVRLKSFSCHHEDHEDTTYRECQTCHDYDLALETGKVSDWAVAVTTAPREQPTLERSLASLAQAGWPEPLVYAEPDVPCPAAVPANRFVQRICAFGAWPNWFATANELYMMQPRADAYFICQDDVLYARDLRAYLEKSLWPNSRLGVVSLHTPSHRARPDWRGFHADNEGWRSWGAQAYVFSNPSLRALLRHPMVINHRQRGPRGGTRNIDSVVGYWCAISGLDYIIHQPSLTQHIGDTSTLWPDAAITGKRRASTFVGETTSVADLMPVEQSTD